MSRYWTWQPEDLPWLKRMLGAWTAEETYEIARVFADLMLEQGRIPLAAQKPMSNRLRKLKQLSEMEAGPYSERARSRLDVWIGAWADLRWAQLQRGLNPGNPGRGPMNYRVFEVPANPDEAAAVAAARHAVDSLLPRMLDWGCVPTELSYTSSSLAGMIGVDVQLPLPTVVSDYSAGGYSVAKFSGHDQLFNYTSGIYHVEAYRVGPRQGHRRMRIRGLLPQVETMFAP